MLFDTGKELKIAIIGAGNWAKTAHIPALIAQSGIRIVGITDIDPQHAHTLGETFGIPVFPDLESMLQSNPADILDVVTSRGMHFHPTMTGLARGLHILCEKPLGHSLLESRQLYQLSKEKQVVTHLGFTFRYSPAVQYMRDLVQQKFLGDIYHFQGFEENAQLIDPLTPLPRIGFSPKTDSGALHGFGSHLLDLARWILGEFREVQGDMATFINERPVIGEDARLKVEVDDSTTVLGRFESGAQALMQFSKIAIGNAPGVEMRIFGSQGALWVRLEDTPEGFEKLWAADRKNRNFHPLPVPASYREDSAWGYQPELGWPLAYFYRLVRHFLQRLRAHEKIEGNCDFSDGYKVQEIIEAIQLSHVARRIVNLSEIR